MVPPISVLTPRTPVKPPSALAFFIGFSLSAHSKVSLLTVLTNLCKHELVMKYFRIIEMNQKFNTSSNHLFIHTMKSCENFIVVGRIHIFTAFLIQIEGDQFVFVAQMTFQLYSSPLQTLHSNYVQS